MDNFKGYIEERLTGMYNSYNSTILEGFKRKTDKEIVHSHKKQFINYLVFKYDNPVIKDEFKNAETDKEKEAIINKYSKDFDEWVKREKGRETALKSALLSLGFTLTGTAPAISNLFCVIAWGKLIGIYAVDSKVRDDVRRERNKK